MKQIGILGGLLAAAMTASYLSWTADNKAPEGEDAVAMYVAGTSDLQQVSWKSDELSVVVERKSDDKGDYTWVTVTERKEVTPEPIIPPEPDAPEDPVPADEGDPEGDPEGEDPAEPEVVPKPEPVYEEEVVAFTGSRAANDLWEKFGPLYALRELTVEDPNSAVFGLDEPEATIGVVRTSGAIEIAVGGDSFGTKDKYVRLDGKVYLLNDADLRPLQHGKARLVERNLVPFKSKDARQLAVQAGGENVSFKQQNIDDQSAAFWERDDKPGEADDAAGSWIDNLLRMHVAEYVAADKAPPLKSIMTYTVRGKSEQWVVEIFEETGLVSPEYYAQTEYNRSLVKLTKSQAGVVIDDLDTVLSGEARDAIEDDGEVGDGDPGDKPEIGAPAHP